MQKIKIVTAIFVTLFLTLALIKGTTSQESNEMQTFFSKEYAGISIQVNATRETIPSANMTIELWVDCTADGVYVNSLNLSVYGYRHFRYGLEKLSLCFTCVINNTFLVYHNTTASNYTIAIPDDVWDLAYAELHLKYSIKVSPYEYSEVFPITTVRNIVWEELENKLSWLNNTILQLNETFWESFQMNLTTENLAYINRTFWELQRNYASLQQNYTSLQQNYTSLQQNYTSLQEDYASLKGSTDNTRTAATVLAITTVSFVATTIYMVIRKPKEHW